MTALDMGLRKPAGSLADGKLDLVYPCPSMSRVCLCIDPIRERLGWECGDLEVVGCDVSGHAMRRGVFR